MNAARKIIYEKNYNPIREYWEKIKEKPLFAEIEKLQTEDTGSRVEGKCQTLLFWYKEKKNLKKKNRKTEQSEKNSIV